MRISDWSSDVCSSDLVTDSLIKEVAAARGVAHAPTSGDEALLARLLYPIVNEGAKILEEGIALRASDIDIAAVLGYNWPVYRGGPLFWADQVGLDRIVVEMRRLEAVHGETFCPAPLLVRLAAIGRASCRGRVCRYVCILEVAASLKK